MLLLLVLLLLLLLVLTAPLLSPLLESVEVLAKRPKRRGRAKLYYLRDRKLPESNFSDEAVLKMAARRQASAKR